MKKLFMMLALLASGVFLTGCINKEPSAEVQAQIVQANETGKYQDYSAAKLEALKGKQPFVVFFYAGWCPTCHNWEKRVVSNIDALPVNTKILKADYDTDGSFFGVSSQSTALFFDANGTKVKSVLDPSMDVLKEFFNTKVLAVKTTETEIVAENKNTESVETSDDEKTEEKEVIDNDEKVETVERNDEETEEVNAIDTNVELAVEATDTSEAVFAPFLYLDYSATERAKYDGKQKYGIFFHADWCPACIAYEKKIMNRAGELPESSVLLKANYDQETELRKELGVTSQTTFVVFDASGKVVLKRVNPSFETLAENLK